MKCSINGKKGSAVYLIFCRFGLLKVLEQYNFLNFILFIFLRAIKLEDGLRSLSVDVQLLLGQVFELWNMASSIRQIGYCE